MKSIFKCLGSSRFRKDTIGVHGRQGEETESLKNVLLGFSICVKVSISSVKM